MGGVFGWMGGIGLLAIAAPAFGQGLSGNAERGGQLAERWCSTCHIVSVSQEAPRQTAQSKQVRRVWARRDQFRQFGIGSEGIIPATTLENNEKIRRRAGAENGFAGGVGGGTGTGV